MTDDVQKWTAARVLVPREATPAMVRAALDRPHGADLPTLYHGIWSAIDAALSEIGRLRAEVASLRLTLGGRTFSATAPEPIGCPAPGACAQVAEIGRLQRGWLRIIQGENGCQTSGEPCQAKRCGCVEERELLAND